MRTKLGLAFVVLHVLIEVSQPVFVLDLELPALAQWIPVARTLSIRLVHLVLGFW